jgi:hypothetical protein
MIGLIYMKKNQLAFYQAKEYPLQIGKLYFVEYCYIRDDDQNRIDFVNVNGDKGRMDNVTCIILSNAVKYENKWSSTVSYKVKILTNTGIVGWVSAIYFNTFQLIES